MRLPSTKIIAAAVAVLVLAGGAYAYFFRAPESLADDYREDAGPAFEKVDDSMYEVFESFRSRYFQGLAIKELTAKRLDDDLGALRRAYRKQYAADRAAIKQANEAIAAAQTQIDEAEPKLTEIDSWPLLGGRGALGGADDDASDAQDYLDELREFLPQYQGLVAYSKKTLAIEEEATYAILDESPGENASLETYKASVNATLDRLRKAQRSFEKLGKAPEDAKAFRYATDEGLDLTIDFFAKLDQAFDQLNPGLLDEAQAQIDEDLKRFGRRLFIEFNQLQRGGGLGGFIGTIEGTESELSRKLDAEDGPESVAPSLLPPDEKDNDQKA